MITRRSTQNPTDKGGWSAFITALDGVTVSNPCGNFALRGSGQKTWFGWPMDEKLESLRDACFDAPDQRSQKAIAGQIPLRGLETLPYIPASPNRSVDRVPLGHRQFSSCSGRTAVVATFLDSGRRRYYETQPNVCIRATEWLKSTYCGYPSPALPHAARSTRPSGTSPDRLQQRLAVGDPSRGPYPTLTAAPTSRLGTQNAECRSWTSTDDVSNSPAVDLPPAPNVHPSPRPKKLWLSRDVGSGRMSRCCRKCR